MLKKLLVSAATVCVLLSPSVMAYENDCFKKCSKTQTRFKGNIVDKVVKAVSQAGISAAQTKKIAIGIAEYRDTMTKIKGMKIFPIDSFMDDNFNEKRFIKEMNEKYLAGIAANAALFKYMFAVLNKEQGKAFKNAYAAPVIERMIKLNY